jgi:hypothetical protein
MSGGGHIVTIWDALLVAVTIYIVYKLWKRLLSDSPSSRPVINTSSNKHLHITQIDKTYTEFIQYASDNENTSIFATKRTYDHILIVFPGNPGVVDIYDHLLDTLNERFKKINAWKDQSHCILAVGFPGHTFNPTIRDKDQHFYSLKEQIAHKKAFVESIHEVSPNAKIYLAGHSVGALMCVKCFNTSTAPISKMFMLYPTIQNMHETSNAKFYGKFFRIGLRSVFANVAHSLSYLPRFVHDLAFKLDQSSSSDILKPYLSSFLNYQLVSNVIFLAMCEFAEIRELSDDEKEQLNSRCNDLFFIFGKTDNWVPMEHVEKITNMLDKHNEESRKLHLHIDHEHGTKHAFVVYKDDIKIVSEFIGSRISTK